MSAPIQRYTMDMNGYGEPDPEGQYVQYADHVAVLADLRATVEGLRDHDRRELAPTAFGSYGEMTLGHLRGRIAALEAIIALLAE